MNWSSQKGGLQTGLNSVVLAPLVVIIVFGISLWCVLCVLVFSKVVSPHGGKAVVVAAPGFTIDLTSGSQRKTETCCCLLCQAGVVWFSLAGPLGRHGPSLTNEWSRVIFDGSVWAIRPPQWALRVSPNFSKLHILSKKNNLVQYT